MELINNTQTKVNKAELEHLAASVIKRLGVKNNLKFELIFVGPDEIASLAQKAFLERRPTDVLSFPQTANEEGFLGSVVICPEVAAKQAKRAGIDVGEEIKILLGHGLLHLLGYHHQG